MQIKKKCLNLDQDPIIHDCLDPDWVHNTLVKIIEICKTFRQGEGHIGFLVGQLENPAN